MAPQAEPIDPALPGPLAQAGQLWTVPIYA
jgi:hypothetical protein